MGFNGSGVFNRIYNWVTDRNNGVKVLSARMDQEMDGFAAGLSNCVTKDGQTATTAVVPFAQGIRIAANAPASPSNGDMWSDGDGVWIRMNGISVNLMPIGMEMPWGSNTPPAGWLLCAGQNVSRVTYAKLFAVLGTSCGAGDGSSTFGLPDYRGRVPFGRDDMGGAAANRITSGISGIAATVLGATGGSQELHQHTHAQDPHAHPLFDPSHGHNIFDPGHAHGYRRAGGNNVDISVAGTPNAELLASATTDTATTGIGIYNTLTGIVVQNATATNKFTGAGASQNVPPAIIRNWLIFAGV